MGRIEISPQDFTRPDRGSDRGAVWNVLRLSAPALVLPLVLLGGCKGKPEPQAPAAAARKPAAKTAKKPPAKSRPTPDATTIPLLEMSRLNPPPVPGDEAYVRNLFSFEEDPAVVAERKRQAEEAAARAAEAAKKAAEEAAKRAAEIAANPPKPQPPAITFEFLGYFGDPRARIGVFAPKGSSDIILAVDGDKIFGNFIVKEIGFETAEIGFTDFPDTKRVPLTAGGGK